MVQLVIARYQQQSDRDEEELVKSPICLVIILGEVQESSDDCAYDRENRVKIPRALPKSLPSKPNDAYSDIGDIEHREDKEDIVYRCQLSLKQTYKGAHLSSAATTQAPGRTQGPEVQGAGTRSSSAAAATFHVS
jgi:hypothetical protein